MEKEIESISLLLLSNKSPVYYRGGNPQSCAPDSKPKNSGVVKL